MVTSISATERVKLWDKFSGPVDQQTIKSDFIRKVNCRNPPFRFKMKPKLRQCAEIPQMVEYHYKHPPPLIPSLRDVLRCDRLIKRHYQYVEPSEPDIRNEIDRNIQEFHEAKRKIERFENEIIDCEDETNENNDGNETENNTKFDSVDDQMEPVESIEINGKNEQKTIESNEPILATSDEIEEDLKLILNGNGEIHSNGVTDEPEKLSNTTKIQKRKRNISTKSIGAECMEMVDISSETLKTKLRKQNSNECEIGDIEERMNCLDADLIRKLATRQLCQILNENSELLTKCHAETANMAIRDALRAIPIKLKLPSQLLSTQEIARIAEQFANSSSSSDTDDDFELFPRITHPPDIYENNFAHLNTDEDKAMAIAKRLEEPLRESRIRARAVLTPINEIIIGKRWYTDVTVDNSIFMRYRSLSIGTNFECQMRLEPTIGKTKCARISPLHATIFYDEVRQIQ